MTSSPETHSATKHLMSIYRCTQCDHITIVPRPRADAVDVDMHNMTMVPKMPRSRAKMSPSNTISAYCLTCMQDYKLPIDFVRDLESVEFDDGDDSFYHLDRRTWTRRNDTNITELRYTFATGDRFITSVGTQSDANVPT